MWDYIIFGTIILLVFCVVGYGQYQKRKIPTALKEKYTWWDAIGEFLYCIAEAIGHVH